LTDTASNAGQAAVGSPQVSRPAQEAYAPAPAPGVSRYSLGILPPAIAVAEFIAIVAIIWGIDWLFPGLDINNLQPSPYWIPVLLLSLQYGTASGSLAAIFAIAAYFAFATLPEQGVGENEFTYRLRVLTQPIMWIAAAVLLGQFRMVQIAAKQELTRRVDELERQRQSLADYSNGLRDRCDALERHIAGLPTARAASLLAVLAALRAPATTPQTGFARLMAQAYPGMTASLFERRGSSLQRIATTGGDTPAAGLAELGADHPLAVAVLDREMAPSVLTPAGETALAGQGLAAVPVRQVIGGRIIGLLKVEAASAEVIISGLTDELEVLATALAPLLDGGDSDAGSLAQARQPRAAPRLATVGDGAGADSTGSSVLAVELIRPKVVR
jgi:polysaccharide biosynthesis protein PelD